jgi:hypothetical protein
MITVGGPSQKTFKKELNHFLLPAGLCCFGPISQENIRHELQGNNNEEEKFCSQQYRN